MKLISVNVSPPIPVAHAGGHVTTGIFKRPVVDRLMMRMLNLEGDGQADQANHGGIYKAVYAYPVEHYNHWQRELGWNDFAFGQFGENLTVEELSEDTVCIGDRFRVGEALVEVTQPRTPCFKLDIRMKTNGFLKSFLASLRVGFYLRVIEEGTVGAGDAIERIHRDSARLSIQALTRLMHFDRDNLAGARYALQVAALAPAWREVLEARVQPDGASPRAGRIAASTEP